MVGEEVSQFYPWAERLVSLSKGVTIGDVSLYVQRKLHAEIRQKEPHSIRLSVGVLEWNRKKQLNQDTAQDIPLTIHLLSHRSTGATKFMKLIVSYRQSKEYPILDSAEEYIQHRIEVVAATIVNQFYSKS